MTYNEFIQNIINTRGQWNITNDEYYEVHHIVPKCLGGLPKYYRKTTKHKNLIWLLPGEHFIAHKLLAEENSENKSLVNAYWAMCTCSTKKICSAEEYAEARQLHSKNMSGENNPFFGKKHSDAFKSMVAEKSRKNNLGRPGTTNKKVLCINTGIIFNSEKEAAAWANVTLSAISDCCHGRNNCLRAGGYYFAFLDDLARQEQLKNKVGTPQSFEISEETKIKIGSAMRGKHQSKETCEKISKSKFGHTVSEETRAKISAKQKGKKISEETRQKMSLANTGKPGTNNKKLLCIETSEIFNSISDAAEKLHVSRSLIYKNLKNNKTKLNLTFKILKD